MKSIVLLPILLFGCAHRASVSMMRPADIDVPGDIESVIVVNRSTPKNLGQTVLELAEGSVTGEGPMMDMVSSDLAVETLIELLEESPRYDVMSFRVDGKEVDANLFDRELSWKTVERLCRRAECDAVIALETFDSDTSQHIEVVDQPEKEREVTASKDSNVVARWRIYDADDRRVVDEVREGFSAHTESDDQAVRAAVDSLPDTDDVVGRLAQDAGVAYAERIAPLEVWTTRPLYGTGSKAMRKARKRAAAGHWEQAMKIWNRVVSKSTGKLKAKANYNLAVAHEVLGEVDQAIVLARKAERKMSKARTRNYVSKLEQRRIDEERAFAQIGLKGVGKDQPVVPTATIEDNRETKTSLEVSTGE